jgi:hypothetical protein
MYLQALFPQNLTSMCHLVSCAACEHVSPCELCHLVSCGTVPLWEGTLTRHGMALRLVSNLMSLSHRSLLPATFAGHTHTLAIDSECADVTQQRHVLICHCD